MALMAFGIPLLATALYLALFSRPGGRFAHRAPAIRGEERAERVSVRTVFFTAADGARLEGWLFEPVETTRSVVIMAPGLTGTKDGLLEPFAWEFVRAGWAVLLFDFRSCGGSEGEPRHWIDPFRQIEDYESALDWAAVRYGRVVLWGSSFSGGEVISVAAKHPGRVHGVISQVPFMATPPHIRPRGWKMASFVVLTMLDLLRSAAGRVGLRLPPVYIRAFGRPGEFVFAPSRENPSARAFDEHRDCHEFWGRLPREIRGGWDNVMLARVLAGLDDYRPLDVVHQVACPIHLIGAEHDDMIPVEYVRKGFARIPHERKRLRIYPCEHFSVYLSPLFEKNAEEQCEFLAECER